MVVKRTEVWLVSLNPTVGKEIEKTRPCMIISPDESNKYLETVVVAPLTSSNKNYPSRVECKFAGREGQVVIDQIRSVDKSRLHKKLGILDKNTSLKVFTVLHEYFAY